MVIELAHQQPADAQGRARCGQRGRLDQQHLGDRQPSLQHRADRPQPRRERGQPDGGLRQRQGVGGPEEHAHRDEQPEELQAREPLHAAAHHGLVARDLRDVEGRLRVARRHVVRAPAGRLEPHAQLVGPAARMP
ncbi:hypothetical protein D9M69_575250 [compost metagenome]